MKCFLKILILFAVVACQSKKIEPECFLIPEGFTGTVTIFYNELNGQEKAYINNKRLYVIPPTGILSTKFSSETGLIDQVYYYVYAKGGKRQIQIDSSQFYYDQPSSKNRFIKKHQNDTLIMTYGITGSSGEKKFQQFVIGTFQSNNSADSTIIE